MNSYHVTRAHASTPSWFYVLVGVLVAAAVMAVSVPAFASQDVTVCGEDVAVQVGSRVCDLGEEIESLAIAGDLVDVMGDVAVVGGGEPGRILVNGERVAPTYRLQEGDIVEPVTGRDVVEETVAHSETIPIPLEYQGDGALVELASVGAPGVARVDCGVVSGSVVASEVVTPAEPMILRRYAPPTNDKLIALTFDDGPWPVHTQQVLQILEREQVKATFFMLGKQVRRNRDLARQVADAGHLVGNHSLSHVYLSAATPELARSEIENAQAEIERTIGVRPTWYRPAGGIVSPAVWAQTRESRVNLVTWTVDPKDYRCTSAVVLAQRVIESAHPGAVVLLHDGGGDRTTTVSALTTIIRTLKAQGYTFVTLDEFE